MQRDFQAPVMEFAYVIIMPFLVEVDIFLNVAFTSSRQPFLFCFPSQHNRLPLLFLQDLGN